MSSAKYIEPKEVTQIPEPAITRFLFADTRMAWLWLIVRLYIGYGCLTGIAAFFGVFLNMTFLLSGAVSINPVIGFLALFLILAWRIAGYWGLDRWVLPLLGTPWTGSLRHTKAPTPTASGA